MAKLSAKGGTILEWANTKDGNSYALRPNGEVLVDRGSGWKVFGHLKANVTVEDYIAKVKAEPTFLIGKRAPSFETMQKWSNDGIAHATDGCHVEPDGVCPHGKKSWLLIKGVI